MPITFSFYSWVDSSQRKYVVSGIGPTVQEMELKSRGVYICLLHNPLLYYYISRQSVPRWNGLDTTQLTEWCAHMAVSNNSAHHSFANRNIKPSHPTTTMGNIILKLLWCLFCFYLYNCGSSSFYGTPHCIVSIKMTGILFCLELLSLRVWISMTNDEKVTCFASSLNISLLLAVSF